MTKELALQKIGTTKKGGYNEYVRIIIETQELNEQELALLVHGVNKRRRSWVVDILYAIVSVSVILTISIAGAVIFDLLSC